MQVQAPHWNHANLGGNFGSEMTNAPIYLFIIGMVLCAGFAVLLLVGGGLLIYYLGKGVIGPMRQRQLQRIVEDWADERGYELLEISDLESRDHPFADRFGVGFGKTPGMVKCVEMRDRKGRVRQGWVFVKARVSARGYSGFEPSSLEVAWDD
jgi:hypothetical protein